VIDDGGRPRPARPPRTPGSRKARQPGVDEVYETAGASKRMIAPTTANVVRVLTETADDPHAIVMVPCVLLKIL
jgi:hypothetical protein